MSIDTLSREARHLALEQVGADGQRRIGESAALLIGMGGIGCAAATYLVSSGVGRVVMCDFDAVDETNLGRQVLYQPGDVGKLKVSVSAARLREVNPAVDVVGIEKRLIGEALANAVRQADVILDCTDNFATRFQVSDACVAERRRLITGAAIRFEGQVAVFGPDYDDSPCYRCLYVDADESLGNCAGNGVLAPVPGVVGTLMATEALKTLAGVPVAANVLHLYDAMATEFSRVVIGKRPGCPACAAQQPT